MSARTHLLDVGDGHVLHVAEHGAPGGAPILWVHGGPGSGCSDSVRDLVDPARHRLVLVDQRSAGRSTPHRRNGKRYWASA